MKIHVRGIRFPSDSNQITQNDTKSMIMGQRYQKTLHIDQHNERNNKKVAKPIKKLYEMSCV